MFAFFLFGLSFSLLPANNEQGGAIDFVERLDRTSLTISDKEFEENVEASVSAIAERHPPALPARHVPISHAPPSSSTVHKASLEVPQQSKSHGSEGRSDSDGEENAAVAGLLRTIQRPLSSIGRIFSDDNSSTPLQPAQTRPTSTDRSVARRRPSPGLAADQQQTQPGVEDAAARQASKETEDARQMRAREESHVVETLCGMFPALDREVVIDVVRANEGRIGSAVDACLALSS